MDSEVELESFLVGDYEISLDWNVFGIIGIDDRKITSLES